MKLLSIAVGEAEAEMLAEISQCRIPFGTSRAEREDILDGCEIHVFKAKSGRRALRIEQKISQREWSWIRAQLKAGR